MMLPLFRSHTGVIKNLPPAGWMHHRTTWHPLEWVTAPHFDLGPTRNLALPFSSLRLLFLFSPNP